MMEMVVTTGSIRRAEVPRAVFPFSLLTALTANNHASILKQVYMLMYGNSKEVVLCRYWHRTWSTI